MNSKNIVLFFCVTLYILRCQGAPLTEVQLRTISNLVMEYRNPDGIHHEENGGLTINLNGVQDIITDAAVRINRQKKIPSVEELQTIISNYKFRLWEVQGYVAHYFGQPVLTRAAAALLALLFTIYDRPSGINFEQLKDLLCKIRESNLRILADFPYLEKPKTAVAQKSARSVYKFSWREVEFIVADYLLS